MLQLIELLMIDDNLSDVRLTQEYFKEYKIPNHLHVVKDGTEALRFLRREGEYYSATRPDLILLDSRILLTDEGSLLPQIKREAERQRVVWVVMTTCEGEATLLQQDWPNSLYITKPLNFERLSALVQRMDGFWFSIGVDPSPKPATTA
jgi:CheY-like chemotaxis protein